MIINAWMWASLFIGVKSQRALFPDGSTGNEFYTPVQAVTPILKYIPKDKIVWCPFDTEESHFVKEISKTNPVVHSHIFNGQDFFKYEPERWDVMVSNPPFQGKKKVFERALSFGKPFALFMSLLWLNDVAPKQLFKDRDLELLMLDKRTNFVKPDGTTDKQVPFSTAYYCYQMLPKQILMISV